jgi:hypothetical protein
MLAQQGDGAVEVGRFEGAVGRSARRGRRDAAPLGELLADPVVVAGSGHRLGGRLVGGGHGVREPGGRQHGGLVVLDRRERPQQGAGRERGAPQRGVRCGQ